MLIKIGDNAIINMASISKILLRQDGSSYKVEIYYADMYGKSETFKFNCLDDFDLAMKVKNEVADQVKELENARATQILEDAIRNG
jgi:hypothetical protein